MNKEEAIDAFVKIMRKSVVGAHEDLVDPIGKHIPKKIQERTDWYNSLNQKEQNYVKELMHEAGEHVMFGFFCAVDGVRKIFKEDVNIELLFNNKKVISEEEYDYDWHDLFKIKLDQQKNSNNS